MVAFDWKREWVPPFLPPPPLACLLEKAIGQEGDRLILQCEVFVPWNYSSADSAEETITGCLWPLGSGHGFPWNTCLYWLTWEGHLQLKWQLPNIAQILCPPNHLLTIMCIIVHQPSWMWCLMPYMTFMAVSQYPPQPLRVWLTWVWPWRKVPSTEDGLDIFNPSFRLGIWSCMAKEQPQWWTAWVISALRGLWGLGCASITPRCLFPF